MQMGLAKAFEATGQSMTCCYSSLLLTVSWTERACYRLGLSLEEDVPGQKGQSAKATTKTTRYLLSLLHRLLSLPPPHCLSLSICLSLSLHIAEMPLSPYLAQLTALMCSPQFPHSRIPEPLPSLLINKTQLGPGSWPLF